MWLALAAVLLFVAPVLTALVTAMNQPIRAQLTYVLVFAFYAYALCLLAHDGLRAVRARKWPMKAVKKTLSSVLLVLLLWTAWGQAVTMNQLWETLYETYQSDMLTAERLYGEICRMADRPDMENCKVVLVGTRKAELTGRPVMGDVIGFSYFQFGYTDYIGVTPRARNFFLTLGMPMGMPTAEDYAKAVEACAGKPCWPAGNSMFMLDDMVVVKLSEVSLGGS